MVMQIQIEAINGRNIILNHMELSISELPMKFGENMKKDLRTRLKNTGTIIWILHV